MEEKKYLLMWLEAPLQSWGDSSRYSRRETLDFPTKSGVYGLLLCALGLSGPQVELLEKMSSFNLDVIGFKRTNADKVSTEILKDFHMIGSGYDNSDPWERYMIPKTSEEKPAVGGGSKLTYRYYIQDMAFACILEVPNKFEYDLVSALENPKWTICLGRKCCVPTDIVCRGYFSSYDKAKEMALSIAQKKDRETSIAVYDGTRDELEGEFMTLNDVPLQFGTDKKYRERTVTIQKIKRDNE